MPKKITGYVVIGAVAITVLILVYIFVTKGYLGKGIITPPSTQTPTPSPSPSPEATVKVVVIFEGEGSFSQIEKDEIESKVINPYIDYYAELPDQTLLTMTIAKNLLASKDTYPFSVKTIFKSGGNSGFLIMKKGTGLAWWLPECMGGCNLSASFKAKYPEIAAGVQ